MYLARWPARAERVASDSSWASLGLDRRVPGKWVPRRRQTSSRSRRQVPHRRLGAARDSCLQGTNVLSSTRQYGHVASIHVTTKRSSFTSLPWRSSGLPLAGTYAFPPPPRETCEWRHSPSPSYEASAGPGPRFHDGSHRYLASRGREGLRGRLARPPRRGPRPRSRPRRVRSHRRVRGLTRTRRGQTRQQRRHQPHCHRRVLALAA